MGLFGSFNPFKAVTRAIGIKDKQAQFITDIFPGTVLLGSNLPSYAKRLGGHSSQPAITGYRTVQGPAQPSPYNVPYYGGGGGFSDPFSYGQLPPYNPLGGPAPWDYSTGSQTYLVPQYQASSGGSERSWEDLALAALPLFL